MIFDRTCEIRRNFDHELVKKLVETEYNPMTPVVEDEEEDAFFIHWGKAGFQNGKQKWKSKIKSKNRSEKQNPERIEKSETVPDFIFFWNGYGSGVSGNGFERQKLYNFKRKMVL